MHCSKTAWLAAIALLAWMPTAQAQDDFEYDEPSEQLATAIDSGSVAAVRRLLDQGMSADTLVYDAPAIQWAIWDERYYVTKLLVDRGADVNRADAEGYTPLMAACNTGNLRIAKLLLEHHAHPDAEESTYGITALHEACTFGSEPIVDLLIEHGADLQHKDKYGGNCLEEAACYGHQQLVEKLRAKGLSSEWPLHIACGLGDVELVHKLVADSADVNQPNAGWKNTPLHFAACGGQLEVAQLLAQHGAKLDAKNVLGATPLHCAAGADHLPIAKWLVAQGADVNAPDTDGSTPLDWAGEDVYEMLERHGAVHSEWDEDEATTDANEETIE